MLKAEAIMKETNMFKLFYILFSARLFIRVKRVIISLLLKIFSYENGLDDLYRFFLAL